MALGLLGRSPYCGGRRAIPIDMAKENTHRCTALVWLVSIKGDLFLIGQGRKQQVVYGSIEKGG